MKRIAIWAFKKFGPAIGTYVATKAVDKFLTQRMSKPQTTSPAVSNLESVGEPEELEREEMLKGSQGLIPISMEDFAKLDHLRREFEGMDGSGAKRRAQDLVAVMNYLQPSNDLPKSKEFDASKNGISVTLDEFETLNTIKEHFQKQTASGSSDAAGFARGALRRLVPLMNRLKVTPNGVLIPVPEFDIRTLETLQKYFEGMDANKGVFSNTAEERQQYAQSMLLYLNGLITRARTVQGR